MKKWVIIDYKNGNRTIMEKSEYEKVQPHSGRTSILPNARALAHV